MHRAGAPRLGQERAARPGRGRPEVGPAALRRRDVEPRARHRHGRGRPRHAGRVAAVGRERAAAASAVPATRSARSRRACSSRSTAPTCCTRRSSPSACSAGAIEAIARSGEPARHARAADRRGDARSTSRRRGLVRARAPGRAVRRAAAVGVRRDPRPARRPLPVRRVRRAARPHRVGSRRRHDRRAAAARSDSPSRAAARSPTAACSACSWSARRVPGAASASSTRRWSTSRASATSSRSARRAGASRRSRTTGCSSPPAFGQPGRLPFWKGDGIGRPAELGEAIGGFIAELVERADTPTPSLAAATPASTSGPRTNLVKFIDDQREATRVRARRDEPRGRALPRRARRLAHRAALPVRHAGARAVGARGRRARPRADAGSTATPSRATTASCCACPTPATSRRAPSCSCSSPPSSTRSSPRGRRFGAVRVAVPRVRRAGAAPAAHRTPASGRRSGSSGSGRRSCSRSPATSPTSRSSSRRCASAAGRLRPARPHPARRAHRAPRAALRRDVTTESPCPFASTCSSATSARSCTRATPRSPSAGPRRSRSTRRCSPSCSARSSCASCSTPRSSTRSSASCSASTPSALARGVEGVADLLRELGPLDADEVAGARRRRDGCRGGRSPTLVDARRAAPVRFAGESLVRRRRRRRAACATRSACRSRRPPEVFLEPVRDPLGDLVARYARTHGPFTSHAVAERFGIGQVVASAALGRLAGERRVVEGEFLPHGAGMEWCDTEVLRRIRRRSLAALRNEVEPVEPREFARFLPGVAARRRPLERHRRRRGGDRAARGRAHPRERVGGATCCPPASPTTARPCSTS